MRRYLSEDILPIRPKPYIITEDQDAINSDDSLSFITDPDSVSVYEVNSVSASTSQLIQNDDVTDKDKRNYDEENLSRSTASSAETGLWKRFRGVICILLGSVLFSMVTLFVKMLAEMGVEPYEASFWRYLGILLPSIPILVFRACRTSRRQRFLLAEPEDQEKCGIFSTLWPLGKNENWKNCVGLVCRGLIGSTAVILRYYALQYLSVGDMLVIVYASPILVALMARISLGEECGVVLVIVTFTTLGGLVLVAKPPIFTGASSFDGDTLIGTSYAAAALICSSVIVIITRKIRKVDFSIMLIVFGVIGVVQAAGFELAWGTGRFFDIPRELNKSLLIGGLAACAFFGQVAIVLALKYEQAGPVALLRSCEVVFGYFLQYMFLDVVPDVLSGVGATIVITGVVIVASRKWIKMLPQESKVRRVMGWVLY